MLIPLLVPLLTRCKLEGMGFFFSVSLQLLARQNLKLQKKNQHFGLNDCNGLVYNLPCPYNDELIQHAPTTLYAKIMKTIKNVLEALVDQVNAPSYLYVFI